MIALVATLAMAGCTRNDGDTGPTQTPPPTASPGGELARQSFNLIPGQEASLSLTLPRATLVSLAVEFGPSTYSGFTFSGEFGNCTGQGPGTGVHPNEANWELPCGTLAAGDYTLTWTLAAGTAQGDVVVTDEGADG